MKTLRGKEGHKPQSVSQRSHAYPSRLIQRLGAEAPKDLTVVGSIVSLTAPLTAFFCSKNAPGATILKAFDQSKSWRDNGCCVISGFHSQLERQCLDILLRGKQPIVMVVARGLGPLRLPAEQRKALDSGRLTVLSPFPASERRTTADLAKRRNLVVAALADEVVFGYVAPNGSIDDLEKRVRPWPVGTRRLHS